MGVIQGTSYTIRYDNSETVRVFYGNHEISADCLSIIMGSHSGEASEEPAFPSSWLAEEITLEATITDASGLWERLSHPPRSDRWRRRLIRSIMLEGGAHD